MGRRGSVSSIVIIIYKGLSKTAVTRINLSAPWLFIDFLPTTPRAYVYALGIEAASFNPDLYCGLQSLLRDGEDPRLLGMEPSKGSVRIEIFFEVSPKGEGIQREIFLLLLDKPTLWI